MFRHWEFYVGVVLVLNGLLLLFLIYWYERRYRTKQDQELRKKRAIETAGYRPCLYDGRGKWHEGVCADVGCSSLINTPKMGAPEYAHSNR